MASALLPSPRRRAGPRRIPQHDWLAGSRHTPVIGRPGGLTGGSILGWQSSPPAPSPLARYRRRFGGAACPSGRTPTRTSAPWSGRGS